MADRMCCWANCENETVAVNVTIKGNPSERLVFCCVGHAAYSLTQQLDRAYDRRNANRASSPATNAKTPGNAEAVLRNALEQIAGDDEPRAILSGTTAEALRSIARTALASVSAYDGGTK